MLGRSIALGCFGLAAACSGGSGTVTPAPTQSPSPLPSPTPTPTASPTSASMFPLTGSTPPFDAIAAHTSFNWSTSTGPIVAGSAETFGLSADYQTQIFSTVTGGSFSIRKGSEQGFYTSTDLGAAPDQALREFYFQRKDPSVPGKAETLTFFNNFIRDRSSQDNADQIKYVSYASWERSDSDRGQSRFTTYLFGYPSLPENVPTTGGRTYEFRIKGYAIVLPPGSEASIKSITGVVNGTTDFSTGSINFTVGLSTCPGPRCSGAIPLGQFSMSARINDARSGFQGALFKDGVESGTMKGSFYGPQAQEIGFTFASAGKYGAGSDERIIGVAVGK